MAGAAPVLAEAASSGLDGSLMGGAGPGPGVDDLVPSPEVLKDGERLRRILDDPVQAIAPANDAIGEPRASESLGQAILRGLEEVSSNYRELKGKVVESVNEQTGANGGQPFNDGKSVFKLMSLQMQIAEVSLEVELISKGMAKVDATIDQLSKLQ